MTKWKKYLDYLNDWVKMHKGAEFEGCSPVCYDEWCASELTEGEESE